MTQPRPRRTRLRALPLLGRPVIGTMPWVTLITGCLIGTAFLTVLATAHGVTITWYAVAAAALTVTCAAMGDHWRRYSRSLHRHDDVPPADVPTEMHDRM